MKKYGFALIFLLMLMGACALAEISLISYEVTSDAYARVTPIQPGLVLVRHDNGMSSGKFPLATNLATAETLLLALDRGDLDWRKIMR